MTPATPFSAAVTALGDEVRAKWTTKRAEIEARRPDTHDAECGCSTCDATYRQGRSIASFDASARAFGFAVLALVVALAGGVVGMVLRG